jgi:hypothetical protein
MSLMEQPIYPLVVWHICMLMISNSDTCYQSPENGALIIPGRQVVVSVVSAWQVELFRVKGCWSWNVDVDAQSKIGRAS